MVLEVQYYQRQYFAKVFPSPLAFTLHIHFYSSLSGIILDCTLKVIALKSATFSAPESASENYLQTTYFMLFLKNLTKNLEKKLVIKFVFIEQIDIINIYFFCILHLLLFGKIMHGWRKIVFMNPHLYFFSLKNFRLFVFVKKCYQSRFFQQYLHKTLKYK